MRQIGSISDHFCQNAIGPGLCMGRSVDEVREIKRAMCDDKRQETR